MVSLGNNEWFFGIQLNIFVFVVAKLASNILL